MGGSARCHRLRRRLQARRPVTEPGRQHLLELDQRAHRGVLDAGHRAARCRAEADRPPRPPPRRRGGAAAAPCPGPAGSRRPRPAMPRRGSPARGAVRRLDARSARSPAAARPGRRRSTSDAPASASSSRSSLVEVASMSAILAPIQDRNSPRLLAESGPWTSTGRRSCRPGRLALAAPAPAALYRADRRGVLLGAGRQQLEYPASRRGAGSAVCRRRRPGHGFRDPEPTPAPVTTIAWRLAHLIVGVFGARVAGTSADPRSTSRRSSTPAPPTRPCTSSTTSTQPG